MSDYFYLTPPQKYINNKICFNRNLFLIVIIAAIIIILMLNYFNKLNIHKNLFKQYNNEKQYNKTIDEVKVTNEIITPKQDLLRIRDYKSLNDPLSAPTRRLPRHIYPVNPQDYAFDVPTQGYPDNYHYIGNLIRKEDEKIVKLFGRQTYPSSNKYEYYGITSDKNGIEIKILIKTMNNVELYDKDKIYIEFLDPALGYFILYINDLDRPRYNPFIFN